MITQRDLSHGVYYVTRDESAVYRIDTGNVDGLASDEAEQAVARALLGVGQQRIADARHGVSTGKRPTD